MCHPRGIEDFVDAIGELDQFVVVGAQPTDEEFLRDTRHGRHASARLARLTPGRGMGNAGHGRRHDHVRIGHGGGNQRRRLFAVQRALGVVEQGGLGTQLEALLVEGLADAQQLRVGDDKQLLTGLDPQTLGKRGSGGLRNLLVANLGHQIHNRGIPLLGQTIRAAKKRACPGGGLTLVYIESVSF